MVSGSIYIDPDGVSSVSSQMLRTADELDALRRSIVPKVYDVITMSYPLVNELPDTGYSLGSAQDSIGSFDYCATALAEQIRTAGYVLNQVADEGRVMMQELLHQARVVLLVLILALAALMALVAFGRESLTMLALFWVLEMQSLPNSKKTFLYSKN